MSVGYVSVSRSHKRTDYTGLFDWAAENLRLATPANVVSALMSADGRDYIEVLEEYVPRSHYNTLRHFKRLTPQERVQRAKAWFANIEPGRIALHEP
jgi:hypothetical protein